MLRDPDANIWSDAFLRALYNDEQHDIQTKTGPYKDVRVVRIPPMFYSTYMHDWEYAHTDYSDGEVWQPFYFYDVDNTVCTHLWEPQHLEGVTPTTSAVGSYYTQPWEAWSGITPAEPPPVKLPDEFGKVLFIAFDRDPLDPMTKSELEAQDSSWRTRQGEPLAYWRDEEYSNRIYLYPILSSITWQDSETDGEGDPDDSGYGTTTVDIDNNLLVVFEKNMPEISSSGGTSRLAPFLRKYLEYGVISRAYQADTDGYIPSLAEYWSTRKTIGLQMIGRYLQLKRADRNYRLRPHVGEPVRSRRHPRLPSDYPATYP